VPAGTLPAVDWLWANLVLLVGSIVQGAAGFGGNMFAAPFLVLIDPDLVPGPALISALAVNLAMVAREKGDGDWNRVWPALAGRVPGNVAGAAVLVALSGDALRWFFAITVLTVVALSASGLHVRVTPRSLFAGGFGAGFTATSIAIGGPPIALVMQSSDGPVVRSTLARFFTIGIVLSLATLSLFGRFDGDDLVAGLALLPGTLAGFAVSKPFTRILDRGYTRSVILVLSASAAVVALGRAVL